MPAQTKIAFLASEAEVAQAALNRLTALYGAVPAEAADVIVALGGDGFMLQTLHQIEGSGVAVYGMNCGTIGFLMNEYAEEGLHERLASSEETVLNPLSMTATDSAGVKHRALAINEVALLRAGPQAAKLRISVDGKVRMDELVCDGALVSTPAGSTAYNYSAHGPILPIGSDVLALTAMAAFRPRRWRGAIIPDHYEMQFRVLEPVKRPVAVVADQKELRDILEVQVRVARDQQLTLLFDPGKTLEERIFAEQFQV